MFTAAWTTLRIMIALVSFDTGVHPDQCVEQVNGKRHALVCEGRLVATWTDGTSNATIMPDGKTIVQYVNGREEILCTGE